MQDVLIIGADPTGITAGMFCGMYKLKTSVIGEVVGGQIIFAPMIIDYPGVESTTGKEWLEKSLKQLQKSGAELIQDKVTSIKKQDDTTFMLKSKLGNTYNTKNYYLCNRKRKKKDQL